MTPRRCPKCQATIPPGRTSCPRCLLEVAVAAQSPSQPESEESEPAPRRRAPPPAPEELAASFPQLEIRALIGEGGMGAVYRARHKELDREVALKILACDASEEPKLAERFLREARALARLDHPGIVRVYDFGRAGERLYLLMELVEGTNLRRLIGEKRLPPREALAIVPQMCDALQYAHDEGVVHRDIKPENVLVDLHGKVKLADFGLAKLVGAAPDEAHRTETGAVMGTYHYMAPEQLTKPRDVDHRADIYSLGVVFYEMLTGELPLGRFEPPSKRVKVEVGLDEIVLKTLEREPERRYQHAVEVRTDVQGLGTDFARRRAERAESKRMLGQLLVLVAMLLAWHFYWAMNFANGWAALILWSVALGLLAYLAIELSDPDPETRRQPWRIAATIGLYALGCIAWVLFTVATWERGGNDYLQPSVSGVSSRWNAQYLGQLAERITPDASLVARVADVDTATFSIWHLQLWGVVAALVLWGLAAAPSSSRAVRASAAKRTLAQLTFAGMSTLVARVATFDWDDSSPPKAALVLESASTSDLDGTVVAIGEALHDRGYDIGASAEWRIVERDTEAPRGRAVTLDAKPPLFERWKPRSFDDPERLAPRVIAWIVEVDGRVRVHWDLGRVAGDGKRRFHDEIAWIDRLGRELAAE